MVVTQLQLQQVDLGEKHVAVKMDDPVVSEVQSTQTRQPVQCRHGDVFNEVVEDVRVLERGHRLQTLDTHQPVAVQANVAKTAERGERPLREVAQTVVVEMELLQRVLQTGESARLYHAHAQTGQVERA